MVLEKLKNQLAKSLSFALPKSKKEIWLVGENFGTSARDNGYYFFRFLRRKDAEQEVYYIINRGSLDRARVEPLGNIVYRNSVKHYFLYVRAKYCIVSHGIRDAVPIYCFEFCKSGFKPIIYLQHGVVRYKKLPYNSLSYAKSLLRFFVSSDWEKEIIVNHMMPPKIERELKVVNWRLLSFEHIEQNVSSGFSVASPLKKAFLEAEHTGEYEKLLANKNRLVKRIGLPPARVPVTGLPRYDSLIIENKQVELEKHKERGVRTILLFPTWRDSLRGVSETAFLNSEYFKSYADLLSSKAVESLCHNKNLKIVLHLHEGMSKYCHTFEKFRSEYVDIAYPTEDIRNLVLLGDVLLTDYSSLSWEFEVLNKPTVFFQFDKDDYFARRGAYVEEDSDWHGPVCKNIESVVESLKVSVDRQRNGNASTSYELKTHHCCENVYNEIVSIPEKIYFVVYNIYGVGGTVRTVINSLNYLYGKGYDVEVISLRRTSGEPKLGLHPGIKIKSLYDARRGVYKRKNIGFLGKCRNLFVRGFRNLPSVIFDKGEDLYHMVSFANDARLYKEIKSIEKGVLISTLPSLNLFIAKHARRGVKKVGQEHKYFESHAPSLQKKIRKYYSKLDCLTVLTEDDKKIYQKNISGLDVCVQPNGTEIYDLEHDAKKEKKKKVVCLGRFVEQKGIDLLVNAFSIVVDRHPDWSLDIYGGGRLKDSIVGLRDDLELQDNVFIWPSVSNIREVLEEADFFVLPSVFEPFGMVVIEAFASGLPVVSFDLPYGPKLLVKHGYNGLKAKPFEVQDLATKIIELIEDDSLRQEMSQNAVQLARKKYSLEKVGDQLCKNLNI